ncbi:hypothetical protein SO802_026468 [Lithocarpus litseifolius]|uniref:Uncharacterized protein n=1 Tax=Lithocarpus litseifolius TaxID=425828 RepID=A0AAW2C194_9ROSI
MAVKYCLNVGMEGIAQARDGYIVAGVERDYSEFIRVHLQGFLDGITAHQMEATDSTIRTLEERIRNLELENRQYNPNFSQVKKEILKAAPLEIWLMERLDMIAKPTAGNYGPSNFLSKTVIKSECQTESDWVKFLNKKSNTSIQWNCYWWKCPPPLLWSLGSDHIFIVGLQRATFYKANRLLRQIQYEQGMPGGKRRTFTHMDTNPTSIKNMFLGLEMADQVDQSFAKVHFHWVTTEYSN